MREATTRFFDDLAGRGHEPLLERTSTTVRFEIRDGHHVDRRLLRIDDGDLALVDDDTEAHCTIRTTADTFERLASGHRNPMAATLAGEVEIEGDTRMLIRIQRLFPDSAGMPEAAGNRQAGKRRS